MSIYLLEAKNAGVNVLDSRLSGEHHAQKASSSKKSKTDKRSTGTRVPIQLLVDYRSNGNYLFDFCRDLGVGGIFIETEKPPKHGEEIDLTFTIPDSKVTLKTKGSVIWVQEKVEGRDDLTPGVGVQFKTFSSEQRKTLEDFVSRYSSAASLEGEADATSQTA